jgi:hypothetical protein
MKLFSFSLLALCSVPVLADEVRLILETGNAFQSKNTAAIPGSSTKFSYKDILGRGPTRFGRITAWLRPDEKTGYRIVIAPLTISGRGTLDKAVSFNGQNFVPGAVSGSYRFDSYRFTWWRRWEKTDRLTVRGGFTAKVRAAEISLTQGTTSTSFDNLGVVPLIHLDAEYRLSDNFNLLFDFDGLISTQGSALDGGLYALYSVDSKTSLFVGARMLDGGFSNKRGYNFANLPYLSAGLSVKF